MATTMPRPCSRCGPTPAGTRELYAAGIHALGAIARPLSRTATRFNSKHMTPPALGLSSPEVTGCSATFIRGSNKRVYIIAAVRPLWGTIDSHCSTPCSGSSDSALLERRVGLSGSTLSGSTRAYTAARCDVVHNQLLFVAVQCTFRTRLRPIISPCSV